MRFSVKVEWQCEDGTAASADLGLVERGPCHSASDVGLALADAKPLLRRLQEVVVSEQLRRHWAAQRPCPPCRRPRRLKDVRKRSFHTTLGRVDITNPRFQGCSNCEDQRIICPLSELLPGRTSPELLHPQAKLTTQVPYRQAAALLCELLPETGGLNYATTRNRTLAIGKQIEVEIRNEVDHPQVVSEPAKEMVVAIDGAYVKALPTRRSQRRQLEILTGRIESAPHRGEAFAVVRDLDPLANERLRAILRRCGRGPETDLTILSDEEDGLRGLVGTWFGKKCRHRLDWFHAARRIGQIRKGFRYLPYGGDFRERIAAHNANLNSMKWMLWNDGVEMADFGMTDVRIGLFQHALAYPVERRQHFEGIKARLDELRSYLYANREATTGYAAPYRNGERVSTAHVESTVNPLINWRMCKKKQMAWSRHGAQ